MVEWNCRDTIPYIHRHIKQNDAYASGFDPVRREIARLALHQLVSDGRIHPARIEEVVAKVRKQIEEEIVETGKRTAIDLGIHGLHPDLIRMVGKMKYRSSYGQNLLQHARETANLCAIMASELGHFPPALSTPMREIELFPRVMLTDSLRSKRHPISDSAADRES